MRAQAAPAMPPPSSAAPCGRSLSVSLACPLRIIGHVQAAASFSAKRSASRCIQNLSRDYGGDHAWQWIWPCCLHAIAWLQGAPHEQGVDCPSIPLRPSPRAF